MHQSIESRRTQGLPAALAIMTTDKGKALMDEILKRVAEAQNEEDRLLQQQVAVRNADIGKTLQALLAGGVLSFLLLVTVFLFLKQENARRAKAEAEVRHHRDHLQEIVAARTAELRRANDQLKEEIKEHRQAEEALRESRERLDLALLSSRMATFEWDIVKNKRTWSEGVHRLLGTKPETFTGATEEFFQVIHPEDRRAVQAALARAVETTGEYETEYRAVWPDDSIHHIAARGKVHRDNAGQALRMTGVCWDITARKQAEAALRQSEERYRGLVELSPEAVFVNRNNRIVLVNPAALALFGASSPEQLLGKSPFELFHPDYHALVRERVGQMLAGERTPILEEKILRLDGAAVDVEVVGAPVIDHGERAVQVLLRDITERKRAQAALQQTTEDLRRSNRDLEQFAYVASHDLQEPLRAVGGYVKLLQLRFPEQLDAKARDYIAGACEGAARMEQLITDLLTFSRVGTHGGNFAPADLNAVLDHSLRNLQPGIKSSQAAITHDALPALFVDATQMMQLFQNLIGNALKFHGELPPKIHVGAQRQAGRWVFSVRDNGIGIEPQYYERIFQIFQRLHTRKEYPGTGIGLAICKRIVERHNGAVWVESQPGQGSTFYFSIPQTPSRSGALSSTGREGQGG
jgi:PAS domain S-box-containing protein